MKRNTQEEANYQRNKRLMYKRDSWKCRHCNRRSMLTPHHVIYQSHGGKDDLDNLLTLCMSCHDLVHAKTLVIEIVEKLATDLVVKFWRKL